MHFSQVLEKKDCEILNIRNCSDAIPYQNPDFSVFTIDSLSLMEYIHLDQEHSLVKKCNLELYVLRLQKYDKVSSIFLIFTQFYS